MPDEGQFDRIGRRSFLAAAAGGVVAAGLLRDDQAGPQAAAAPVGPLPTNVTRTWIGPPYWANRLQDWRLNQGRIECLTGTTATRGRTVAVLTRELVAGNLSAQLTVRTGTLARGSTGGFSGFLVGAGGGALDHRAAALVQGASGTGGGLLCTYDSDGRVKFRDHSGESNQFGYPILPAATESGPRPARTLAEDVELRLDIAPLGGDAFRLTLTAVNFASGAVLATAVLNNVAGSRLRGGIALISSCRDASAGARYWFRDLATSGPKVVEQPGRAVGPILGTMWSLNGSVLKLTAQFLPIGASEPQQAQLQYRLPGGAWLNGPTVTIGDGWTALFRLAGWDGTRDWEYRVAYAAGTPAQHLYGGTIARDPVAKSRIVVGVLNCFIHSYRPLDSGSSGAALLPGSQTLGLYTDRNLYFPNQTLAANLASQQPDLLVQWAISTTNTGRPGRTPAPTGRWTWCTAGPSGCGRSGISPGTGRPSCWWTTTTCTTRTCGATAARPHPTATTTWAATPGRPPSSTPSSASSAVTTRTRSTRAPSSRASPSTTGGSGSEASASR
jgi:alkaline phosphatase D